MSPQLRIVRRCSAGLAAMSVACGSGTEPPVEPGPGTLTFSYAGALTGTYTATGDVTTVPTGDNQYRYQWAIAKTFTDVGRRWITIYANAPTVGLSGTSIQMEATPDRVGTYALSGDDYNLVLFTAPDRQESFRFVSGSLRITSLRGARARGSFDGTAVGGTAESDTLVVTSGTFDVPMHFE